jgi:hypothetical protein
MLQVLKNVLEFLSMSFMKISSNNPIVLYCIKRRMYKFDILNFKMQEQQF